MTTRPDYFERYETLAFERDAAGVLVMRLHTRGGSVEYAPAHHRDWAHAFLDVAADPDNQVVILTGTGDAFIDAVDWGSEIRTAADWGPIYWEAKRVLRGLLDIDVPVIGAVNGPATIHAELALLSDVTLAAQHAVFQDAVHIGWKAVPGDGVHIVWPELLGPNRGRYFLWTRQKLDAAEALALGVVNEVLPAAELLGRARQVASELLELPELVRRYTRALFAQRWKRLLEGDLSHGLALEGLGMWGGGGDTGRGRP